MFVTKNQFYVFVACFAFGACVGILFSFSSAIKFFIKNRILRMVPDVITFNLVGIIYSFYALNMCFSNVRVYMVVGVFIGIIAYLKSFHILLAKCAKKFYNIIVKITLKRLEKRKRIKDERIKVKKNNSRNNRRGSNATSYASINNGFSVNIHTSKK